MYLEGLVEPLVYKKATHGTVSGTLLFCTLWMVGQRHFDPGGKEQRTHTSPPEALGNFLDTQSTLDVDPFKRGVFFSRTLD
jgi:hypothetical protein